MTNSTMRSFLLVATLAAVGPLETVAQAIPFYTVHVQHAGRDVEVRVNGVPVSTGESDRSTLVAQLSPFLRNGENVVALHSDRRGASRQPLEFSVRRRGRTVPLKRSPHSRRSPTSRLVSPSYDA